MTRRFTKDCPACGAGPFLSDVAFPSGVCPECHRQGWRGGAAPEAADPASAAAPAAAAPRPIAQPAEAAELAELRRALDDLRADRRRDLQRIEAAAKRAEAAEAESAALRQAVAALSGRVTRLSGDHARLRHTIERDPAAAEHGGEAEAAASDVARASAAYDRIKKADTRAPRPARPLHTVPARRPAEPRPSAPVTRGATPDAGAGPARPSSASKAAVADVATEIRAQRERQAAREAAERERRAAEADAWFQRWQARHGAAKAG